MAPNRIRDLGGNPRFVFFVAEDTKEVAACVAVVNAPDDQYAVLTAWQYVTEQTDAPLPPKAYGARVMSVDALIERVPDLPAVPCPAIPPFGWAAVAGNLPES